MDVSEVQAPPVLEEKEEKGPEEYFNHNNIKNDYSIFIATSNNEMSIRLTEKYTLTEWKCTVKKQALNDISRKTGFELEGNEFINILKKGLSQREIDCYVDILTAEDLENLKNKKQGHQKKAEKQSNNSATSKRYIILTSLTNEKKFHYPLSLTPNKIDLPFDKLKEIHNELRGDLEAARASALNDTQKSESFSINYNNDKNRNNKNLGNLNKNKEIDQVKSENEILKAKLARLEEQVEKKKANIEIEAAIERTRQLKESIETANLDLIDWKNRVQDQEEESVDLKKSLNQLHKKICALLQSEKEVVARKKGEDVEKEFNQIKNNMKKNNNEIEKLKKDLENSKAKVKELEIKAKKLNSEKEVIRKGRKGPYSSAGGSVCSFGSYNSYNSAKRSTGSNASSGSKTKSNYSYNSYSNNRRR